jgi:hypothetical protein
VIISRLRTAVVGGWTRLSAEVEFDQRMAW